MQKGAVLITAVLLISLAVFISVVALTIVTQSYVSSHRLSQDAHNFLLAEAGVTDAVCRMGRLGDFSNKTLNIDGETVNVEITSVGTGRFQIKSKVQ